jgi:hypothetical protein
MSAGGARVEKRSEQQDRISLLLWPRAQAGPLEPCKHAAREYNARTARSYADLTVAPINYGLIQLIFFSRNNIFLSQKNHLTGVFQPAYNSSRTTANQPLAAKPPRFIASGLPANGLVLSDMAGTPSDV